MKVIFTSPVGVVCPPRVDCTFTKRFERGMQAPAFQISGDPAAWVVSSFKVDGQSRLRQKGDVPGDLFATPAIVSFVRLTAIPAGAEVTLQVKYVGDPPGASFVGTFSGRSR